MSGQPDGPAEPRPTHVPVMLPRTLELLAPALIGDAPIIVDATLGLGGHAEALLNMVPSARLIGLDRDPTAIAIASSRLAPFGARVEIVHGGFRDLAGVVAEHADGAVDAILFDLGVSSMQLDLDDRGFAYSRDTALDMRMDPTTGVTAADVVNGYDADRLAMVFRRYGEERFADRIARAVVAERSRSPLTSTARLAELVRDAVPAATRRTGGHPAKRVFQALRIEVNDELGQLRVAIPAAIAALRVGARLTVLSYQSLEDRIVKQTLAAAARPNVPIDLPLLAADLTAELELLTRGAEKAGDDEIASNPRASSVRLRAAVRRRAAA